MENETAAMVILQVILFVPLENRFAGGITSEARECMCAAISLLAGDEGLGHPTGRRIKSALFLRQVIASLMIVLLI